VGVGWNYVEYEGLNEEFSTRGARQAEQIALLRKFWTEPVVDYRGRFHTVDRLGVLPRPRTVIPIWIGGFSEAAYGRAARIADGFLYSLIGTAGPENDPRSTIDHLRTLVDEAGRDPSSFGIDLIVPVAVEPSELAELLEQWRDSGVSHLTLHTYRPGATAAETIELLAEYRRVIG
jgi:alkanesulfonate monooxygenase SsuD/methylene tetrahydromethanopterin reductase-like flavin-dependent oxidoreductase (luciferase family)